MEMHGVADQVDSPIPFRVAQCWNTIIRIRLHNSQLPARETKARMTSKFHLNLPKTAFPLRVNSVQHEPKIQKVLRYYINYYKVDS